MNEGIVIVGMDAVMARFFAQNVASLAARLKTDHVAIHALREDLAPTLPVVSDAYLLKEALTRGRVVTTCWTVDRAKSALALTAAVLPFQVRVYDLARRVW